MSKPKTSKEILLELQKGPDRAPTSFYLSKSLMKRFKKACANASPSTVLEELVKRFLDEVE